MPRKHQGIIQKGGNKGKLKSGLPQIIKCKTKNTKKYKKSHKGGVRKFIKGIPIEKVKAAIPLLMANDLADKEYDRASELARKGGVPYMMKGMRNYDKELKDVEKQLQFARANLNQLYRSQNIVIEEKQMARLRDDIQRLAIKKRKLKRRWLYKVYL